jgi:hypothetical protein
MIGKLLQKNLPSPSLGIQQDPTPQPEPPQDPPDKTPESEVMPGRIKIPIDRYKPFLTDLNMFLAHQSKYNKGFP